MPAVTSRFTTSEVIITPLDFGCASRSFVPKKSTVRNISPRRRSLSATLNVKNSRPSMHTVNNVMVCANPVAYPAICFGERSGAAQRPRREDRANAPPRGKLPTCPGEGHSTASPFDPKEE
jgi:hypothetical protein